MTEVLGIFSEGFASWRRALGAVPMEARLDVFANAAEEVASWLARGLDRAVAADELFDMAAAHDLTDVDVVQQIIADAFARRDEDLERIPGDIEEQPPHHGPNGKQPTSIKILSKAEFVRGFIPPDYLVDGMLQRRFVYALTGQTGHAKTAIALLLAELVSSPDPAMLGNHRVEKGRVVYFVGENPDDLRMRVIGADSQRHDDPLGDNILFIPGQLNISLMYDQIVARLKQAGGCDLVIVDTSAAYFLGSEELNNKQMGDHARMLRRLTELPGGPCVLVLCHPIKYVLEASQLLPRGGGAFLAEMDGNLTAWKHDDTLIELHHGKIRGPGFEAMSFKVEPIKNAKLTDAQGRMIPTVRAIAVSRTDESKQQKKSRDDEDRVLAALLSNPDASMAEIAERWGWTSAGGEPSKSRVKNAIYRLDLSAKPKVLRKNRDKWELTEEGKAAARRAALDFETQNDRAAALQQPRLEL